MGVPLTVSRGALTVEQYHKMADAGAFQEGDRIELVERGIIEMGPLGPAHVSEVNELCGLFARAVADSAIVSIQNPIALPPRNELLPDLALLKPTGHKYKTSLPSACDILLLIKVADTTLANDREVKTPILASHGIREVYLLDVRVGVLLVFRNPAGDTCGAIFTSGKSDTVAPLLLPEVSFREADLWR